MKLRCPRCQKKLAVPDKYAGKAIRCPSCNRAFTVPKARASVSAGGASAAPQVDLESLAKLEAGAGEMDEEELAAARAAVAEARRQRGELRVRTCPNCHRDMHVEDPYAEVLCTHCWNPIPPLVKAPAPKQKKKGRSTTEPKLTGAGGFYTELVSSFTYPFPALSSLLTAALIAIGAGLVPVAVMNGASALMAQSAVGTREGVQTGDVSAAGVLLMGVFGLEVFVFSAIAIHAFFDTVRMTTIGTDTPPNLSWSPAQWGKSFASYIILVVYFNLMSYVVAFFTLDEGAMELLESTDHFDLMSEGGGTKFLVGMVIVTFTIPMNLIGLSVGSTVQGLNPVNVVKSIIHTHIHYVFLVLVLSAAGIMFGGAFSFVLLDWFIPQIIQMIESSKQGNLLQVGFALLAWGLVMAFYFYAAYVLGRLHGLFARTFRRRLQFGHGGSDI